MPESTTEPAIETRATAPEAIETGAVANDSAKSDEDLVGLEPEAYRAEY